MANPFGKIIDVLEHLTENFGVFNAGFSKETAKLFLAESRKELELLFRDDVKIVEQQIEHNNDQNTPPAGPQNEDGVSQ